jgi:hypothetical protein
MKLPEYIINDAKDIRDALKFISKVVNANDTNGNSWFFIASLDDNVNNGKYLISDGVASIKKSVILFARLIANMVISETNDANEAHQYFNSIMDTMQKTLAIHLAAHISGTKLYDDIER